MNFEKTIYQNELAALARDVLGATRERAEGFDPGLWRDLAKAEVLCATLPESLGGAGPWSSGQGLLEQCSVLTEVGRAVAPAPYLGSIVLGASALAAFGTPEQQRRWAQPAARGELLLTAAIEEAAAGCDADPASADPASADPASADPVGPTGWVVSGTATIVPGAPWADAILVPARTDDGVRVFVVERSDRGVSVQPQALTDGVTAGQVTLDGVPLGADRLLSGRHVAEWLVARGTVGLCAVQLGVTERALELTAEYASDRVQFARPIGTFQAVAQRLADAWIDVEAIRLTMWQAAWLLASREAGQLASPQAGADGGGTSIRAAISTAKFWAADAGHRVAHTAVHVHGGVGIDVSYPLHRYFAAAKHNEFALGGATTQLRHIGAELAKLLDRTKSAY
jgi:3-oxocholest-4-en-26-oyl-CoA dehydrogenase beta subunit